MSRPPYDCTGLRRPFMAQLYSRHMRKHHRPKNTHPVVCFLMTQSPHSVESHIAKRRPLGLKQGPGVPGGARLLPDGSHACLQKKICRELAGPQPQTEVQGQSSKPQWRRRQEKSQDTGKEGTEHQPVCKAGPGAQGLRYSHVSELACTLYWGPKTPGSVQGAGHRDMPPFSIRAYELLYWYMQAEMSKVCKLQWERLLLLDRNLERRAGSGGLVVTFGVLCFSGPVPFPGAHLHHSWK